MENVAQRTDLDILQDAIEWISDGLGCIHLDPEQLGEELKRLVKRLEKTSGKGEHEDA